MYTNAISTCDSLSLSGRDPGAKYAEENVIGLCNEWGTDNLGTKSTPTKTPGVGALPDRFCLIFCMKLPLDMQELIASQATPHFSEIHSGKL